MRKLSTPLSSLLKVLHLHIRVLVFLLILNLSFFFNVVFWINRASSGKCFVIWLYYSKNSLYMILWANIHGPSQLMRANIHGPSQLMRIRIATTSGRDFVKTLLILKQGPFLPKIFVRPDRWVTLPLRFLSPRCLPYPSAPSTRSFPFLPSPRSADSRGLPFSLPKVESKSN
jgi:hypothetical protein